VTTCPYCAFRANTVAEEVEHMNAAHPEVIERRLQSAGLEPPANSARTYTEAEINAAIARVETAKQNHPVGWAFLEALSLPAEDMTVYAFQNAKIHAPRLQMEDDLALVYAAGWMQGLAIGVALAEQRNGA
jgi:hypothetical protein